MEHPHLDPDALIRTAYGVPDAAETAHQAACPACAAAARQMTERRSHVGAQNAVAEIAVEELPETFWLRQKQAILAAAARPAPQPFRRAAVGFALAMLVLLALWTLHAPMPSGPAPGPSREIEDAQLLRDVRILVHQSEPRALSPVTLLFSDRAKEEFRP